MIHESFQEFLKLCYVVTHKNSPLCKAFYFREEADKYWDEQHKKSEEPKMLTVPINELNKYISKEEIEEFKVKNNIRRLTCQ